MATARTGSDGIAKFSNTNFEEGFNPRMIIANKGDDFNYMQLIKSRVKTSRFEVGGKWPNASNYDLFIYGERELYRPGETIHVAGIVRDYEWEMTGKMPVNIVLKYPDGKEFKTARKTLNEQGMFSAEFEVPSTAMTGSYVAEVYTGKDIYLGQKSIQVEEFMPDRIKVDLDINQEEYRPGDTIFADAIARNYFGPSGSK